MKKGQNVIENARVGMILDPRNCEKRPKSPQGVKWQVSEPGANAA
jgi:hypothetical protein